ncbi:MAG: hypothetical protein QNJ92_06870 [Alphaproteobacteria bacterium]|nr:hypothetical protein [Alphaproteobacteria bacterium]
MPNFFATNKAHLSGLGAGFAAWLVGGLQTGTGMPEELAMGLTGAVAWLITYWAPNKIKEAQAGTE